MMTKKTSKANIWLKKIIVAPILAVNIFLFAERVEAQEIIEVREVPLETIEEQTKNINSLDNEIYKEYYFRNSIITITDKNGKKIQKKYTELTEEEKKKVIPPPPLKRKIKRPTKKIINDLKDKSKYVIWIDGKAVDNSVLNNYNYSDFTNYSMSFINKNARSKKQPQEYKYHLETKDYFTVQNKKRSADFLKYLVEKYDIEEVVEEPKFKSGFIKINGKLHHYIIVKGITKYYNKDGKLTNNNGKQLSNKKAKASRIAPNMYIQKVYYKGKVFCEFLDDKPLK